MTNPWYYFGCYGREGHYVYETSMRMNWTTGLELLDGSLCWPEREGLYIAKLTRLPDKGYSTLAFWDRTGDERGASNSIFFAPGLDWSGDDLLAEARRQFPKVFSRLQSCGIEVVIRQAEQPTKPEEA